MVYTEFCYPTHFLKLNPLTNRVSRISQASALHIRWGVELGKVLAKEAAIWWVPWRGVDMVGRNGLYPLVMTNIAMENGPFIDDLPLETSIYEGYCVNFQSC